MPMVPARYTNSYFFLFFAFFFAFLFLKSSALYTYSGKVVEHCICSASLNGLPIVIDDNYPCYADRRVWVPGQWAFRGGCKRWVPGRWIVERVPIPCPPPVRPCPSPAPYLPPQGQFPDDRRSDFFAPAQCEFTSLNEDAFQYTLQSIASRNFESSKLVLVRQVIETNCMSTQQVVQLLNLLNFESSRLEIAKLAYLKTVDKNMYHLVNQAFQSENSVMELAHFIRSLR